MIARSKRLAGLAALLCAACGSSTDPARPIVATAPEPAGAHCPTGGTAILVGLDQDGDGVLAPAEVSETEYVCDGDAPAAVRVDEEPPGPSCADGGYAVHSGLDLNRNGVLDDDEVTDTEYVCAGPDGEGIASDVVFGNLYVLSADDAAALAGVRRITGDLRIDAPDVTDLDLGSLEQLGGVLAVSRIGASSLGAPALTEALSISVTTTALSSVSLPALQYAGDVRISDGELTSLDLSSLTWLGAPGTAGDLELNGGSVGVLDLPALTYLKGVLTLNGVAATEIDAPALRTAHSIYIDQAAGLATIDMSSLRDVVYQLGFTRLPDLATLTMPALETIGDELRISKDDTLGHIDFPALTSAWKLYVVDNPMLPTCEATALAAQVGTDNTTISGNDDGATCN